MNFNASGKKSPMNRAHINRMTQNLVANNKSYLNRRSTILEPVKQPIPRHEMWQVQKEDDGVDPDQKKKAERAWFKTTVKFEKDMEIFETEELGSDDQDDSDEQERDSLSDDSTLEEEEKERRREEKKAEKAARRAARKQAEESPQKPLIEQKPDYGNLRKGIDIIDEEVTTDRAYTVFRELERDEALREFKPPRIAETGGLAGVGDGRFAQEIPSQRIARLQKELQGL